MGPKRICKDYEVGFSRFSIVDESRDEVLGDATGKRKIEIQLFYPVDKDNVKKLDKANYVCEKKALALKKAYHISAKAMKNQKIDAYEDAQMLDEKFPLLIFSHGYNSFIESNTFLLEEIVANGYIVASIGHSYEAVYSEYEDGSGTYYDKSINKKMYQKGIWKAIKTQNKILKCKGSLEEVDELFWNFQNEHTPYIKGRLEEWTKDMLFALEVIKERYGQYIELSNGVAASGHSLGGTTAYNLCMVSDEITCGLNIDGGLFGDYRNCVLKKPFYQISCKSNWNVESSVLLRREAPVYTAIFDKMKHMGFTDVKFIKGLSMLGGKLDADIMHSHEVECHLFILNKYLKGMDIEINKSNSDDIVITTYEK